MVNPQENDFRGILCLPCALGNSVVYLNVQPLWRIRLERKRLSPPKGKIVRNWLLGCIALFFVFIAGCAPLAAQNIVRPGEPWRDDRGQQIQAHGGGILHWHGAYYWFGEDRGVGNDPAKRYVACYRSQDLVHWKFHRQVLALADPEHLGNHWVLERPKVFVNARTGKFVLYAHLDNASYKLARVAVAVSDSIDGEYRYVKSFRPLDQESRDIGQFIDDDGSAYLIFESRPTGGFFIASLSDDYLSVTKQVSFLHAPLEGGAVVHLGGLYYVLGSHMTGWAPNPNVYATAPSLSGPWTEFKNIAPPEANTYNAQSSMLLKVAGSKKTSVIFMGDIWKPAQQWDSRYLWMPLEIGEGSLHLPAPQNWELNIKTGETALRP
jgi:hypothetical protein